MKILVICSAVVLLVVSGVFADDVIIDEYGNVTTGASTTANLEVTTTGEHAILGETSGGSVAGVYGVNTNIGNYGILGYDTYGVYGYGATGSYAGFFDGDVEVKGTLHVVGGLTGVTETDPLFTLWDKSAGISILENQISNLNHFTPADETDPTVNALGKASLSCTANQVAKWNGSAWTCAGAGDTDWTISGTDMYSGVTGDVGIGTTNPVHKLEVHQSSS